jgi:hypothetical protein
LPSTSFAGQINKYFAEDIFGIQWQETVQTIQDNLELGDLKGRETMLLYTVIDGNSLFDATRKGTDRLSYIFNLEGILVGASAEFSANEEVTLGVLNDRLDEIFGPANMNSIQRDPSIEWTNDNGYFMTLSPFVNQSDERKFLLTVLRH